MTSYNLILETPKSTVVAEYDTTTPRARTSSYQSEAELEQELIKILTEQGYEYIKIKTEKDLITNLRRQLSNLNNYQFTDTEWEQFFTTNIANQNSTIIDKTRKIQEDEIQNLTRDNKTTKNIKLIDKKNIHNNRLQIINQYTEERGNHKTRYDVTILVNGLPLIHIELKRRGVALKEAFNQINRYQRDSFWAGSGLYEYTQIFVISNGTRTKYYSNTTRHNHVEKTKTGTKPKTTNTFEFTSYWTDEKNHTIADLTDFAKTFFAKHTILNILTKYCVLTTDNELLAMRPYQIVATEKIINKIQISTHYKQQGTLSAGGYIWHTTGSGKTLTSFKTAQLATALPNIDKVLFIVDRKDLDYQTIKEYDKFQKGAANGNHSTKILERQLSDLEANGKPAATPYKIIVTTIQKLDSFIKKNKTHPIYNKHIVIIFDECHRSQFGEMHKNITNHFKNYHLFGFTGTPIFADNAVRGIDSKATTTEQTFGERLHTYTIVDAINDGNVLPFKIDYVTTIKQKEKDKDKKVQGINTKEALESPQRIENIVSYILENFNQKTKRNSTLPLEQQRNRGFNSIFAVSSIPMCKKYYLELKKQIADHPTLNGLRIATIYSYSANEDDPSEDENCTTDGLDKSSRDFLDLAIQDYNRYFNSNFNTDDDGFQNYYKDVAKRVKDREIDILLVVNMFLTGFDAKTLNTLWVDKRLKQHGLIQAFSRTNRILNSVKTFGNIICFIDLENEVNEALSLFGNKEARGIIILRPFNDYYFGYKKVDGKHEKGYEERIHDLKTLYPLGQEIIGEKNEKEFIVLFGNILRLRNILQSFDEFSEYDTLSERDLQDYTGIYHDLHEKYTRRKGELDSILDDVVFEMELVKQVEINIDYILILVEQYKNKNCQDKEIRVSIDKAIKSSLELRSKKELIETFIETINATSDVQNDWRRFVREQKRADIEALIAEENLKPAETKKFVSDALRDGVLKTIGTGIDKIIKMSRFGGENRNEKKQRVIDKLQALFEKYVGLVGSDDEMDDYEMYGVEMNRDEADMVKMGVGELNGGKIGVGEWSGGKIGVGEWSGGKIGVNEMGVGEVGQDGVATQVSIKYQLMEEGALLYKLKDGHILWESVDTGYAASDNHAPYSREKKEDRDEEDEA